MTVGQEITDELELVYSTNLTDSNDQIWVAEYDVTRRFQTRGVRQSDNSYRFDLQPRRARSAAGRRRAASPVSGPIVHAVRSCRPTAAIPEPELREMLEIEVGERIRFLRRAPAASSRSRRRSKSAVLCSHACDCSARVMRAAVTLNLRVVAGPRVDLVFEGATPPGKVVEEVRTKWRRGVFDTQRIDDGVDALRGWLMRDHYLQPKVEGAVGTSRPDERRVRFQIDPGTRFAKVVLAFEGAAGISPDELDEIINEQDLEQQLFTDPLQVTELLERYYHEQGYLVAAIAQPRYEFEGTQARVVLEVNEGPRFLGSRR